MYGRSPTAGTTDAPVSGVDSPATEIEFNPGPYPARVRSYPAKAAMGAVATVSRSPYPSENCHPRGDYPYMPDFLVSDIQCLESVQESPATSSGRRTSGDET